MTEEDEIKEYCERNNEEAERCEQQLGQAQAIVNNNHTAMEDWNSEKADKLEKVNAAKDARDSIESIKRHEAVDLSSKNRFDCRQYDAACGDDDSWDNINDEYAEKPYGPDLSCAKPSWASTWDPDPCSDLDHTDFTGRRQLYCTARGYTRCNRDNWPSNILGSFTEVEKKVGDVKETGAWQRANDKYQKLKGEYNDLKNNPPTLMPVPNVSCEICDLCVSFKNVNVGGDFNATFEQSCGDIDPGKSYRTCNRRDGSGEMPYLEENGLPLECQDMETCFDGKGNKYEYAPGTEPHGACGESHVCYDEDDNPHFYLDYEERPSKCVGSEDTDDDDEDAPIDSEKKEQIQSMIIIFIVILAIIVTIASAYFSISYLKT